MGEEGSTGERKSSNFYELSEQLKEKCVQLQTYGIEVVNIQKDLAHVQSQTRKLYEDAENDAKRKTQSYQRFLLRIIDILSDISQMPQERRQEEHPGLIERLRKTLLAAVGKVEAADTHSSHEGDSTGSGQMKPELRYLNTVLLDALKGEGVNVVDVERGRLFDPAIHEVSGRITNSKLRAGAIVKLVEPGYAQGSYILKKAKVIIATGKVTN